VAFLVCGMRAHTGAWTGFVCFTVKRRRQEESVLAREFHEMCGLWLATSDVVVIVFLFCICRKRIYKKHKLAPLAQVALRGIMFPAMTMFMVVTALPLTCKERRIYCNWSCVLALLPSVVFVLCT